MGSEVHKCAAGLSRRRIVRDDKGQVTRQDRGIRISPEEGTIFRYRYPEVERAGGIPSWTQIPERECLARLARKVPADGLIVEIGSLYGGMTAVLALAAPKALVYSIDNFSWEPVGPCNASVVRENMRLLGISNVIVYAANSVEFAPAWNHPIDLLWLDGNHGRFYVELDLRYLAPHAEVIAVHDYNEPVCPDVKPVVDELVSQGEWHIAQVVRTLAVLRRRRKNSWLVRRGG